MIETPGILRDGAQSAETEIVRLSPRAEAKPKKARKRRRPGSRGKAYRDAAKLAAKIGGKR
jgi:hypothetical protein